LERWITTIIETSTTSIRHSDKNINEKSLSAKKKLGKNLEKIFTNQKFCRNCNEGRRWLGALGICFECYRETPEYNDNEIIEVAKEIDYSYQIKFEEKKKKEYFNELTTLEDGKTNFVYKILLQKTVDIQKTATIQDNIVLDSNRTIHLKGLDYSLSIFYRIKPPSKFYRFDTNPNRKCFT